MPNPEARPDTPLTLEGYFIRGVVAFPLDSAIPYTLEEAQRELMEARQAIQDICETGLNLAKRLKELGVEI